MKKRILSNFRSLYCKRKYFSCCSETHLENRRSNCYYKKKKNKCTEGERAKDETDNALLKLVVKDEYFNKYLLDCDNSSFVTTRTKIVVQALLLYNYTD